ncbi:MAG TPA: hypothetical protein VFQ44_25965 [Streptosporangiaceae bacterium]|nr:hypothetical protein [Streptosporangiaceae bacterium]
MISLPYLARARNLFSSAHLSLVIDAMIAGNSPGIAWADDAEVPRGVLIWDRAHCLYLAGENAGAWQGLFHSEIAPAGSGMFKLYASLPVTELAGRALLTRERAAWRR